LLKKLSRWKKTLISGLFVVILLFGGVIAWYLEFHPKRTCYYECLFSAQSDLGNSIVAAAEDYQLDNGQFGLTNAGGVVSEIQSTDPSLVFTTGQVNGNMNNVGSAVQVEACSNPAFTSCQWVAMASFQVVLNVCNYVIINKGPPIKSNSIGGIWKGPAIKSNLIPTGTIYATSGNKIVNSCNLKKQNITKAQFGGFPPS
jgi:hypothetical protein